MTFFEKILSSISEEPIQLLDTTISMSEYTLLDLSINNDDLKSIDMADPVSCQAYIDSVLEKKGALVAYGGYLEERELYASNSHFNGEGKELRNIHLGVDFWAGAGTQVHVPINGKVQSYKNNNIKGDYGPTIILSHFIENMEFYTLYGHLSLESLDGLFVGKEFIAGETLATLGTPEINVNYAPHLHFQVIKDMEDHIGDYPGVCTTKEKEYYINNCPNPYYLLKI